MRWYTNPKISVNNIIESEDERKIKAEFAKLLNADAFREGTWFEDYCATLLRISGLGSKTKTKKQQDIADQLYKSLIYGWKGPTQYDPRKITATSIVMTLISIVLSKIDTGAQDVTDEDTKFLLQSLLLNYTVKTYNRVKKETEYSIGTGDDYKTFAAYQNVAEWLYAYKELLGSYTIGTPEEYVSDNSLPNYDLLVARLTEFVQASTTKILQTLFAYQGAANLPYFLLKLVIISLYVKTGQKTGAAILRDSNVRGWENFTYDAKDQFFVENVIKNLSKQNSNTISIANSATAMKMLSEFYKSYSKNILKLSDHLRGITQDMPIYDQAKLTLGRRRSQGSAGLSPGRSEPQLPVQGLSQKQNSNIAIIMRRVKNTPYGDAFCQLLDIASKRDFTPKEKALFQLIIKATCQ